MPSWRMFATIDVVVAFHEQTPQQNILSKPSHLLDESNKLSIGKNSLAQVKNVQV